MSESDLTERCVLLLNAELKTKSTAELETLRASMRKLLVFMGLGGGVRGSPVYKVLFSPSVRVAFVHRQTIFVPQAPLTRDLLVKVLNVVQCQLTHQSPDGFTSLIQALSETVSGGGQVRARAA